MSLFVILKFVHIVAAIVAVGSNLTYTFWLRRAGNDRERLISTLDSIRVLDSMIANPAYIVLLLSGLAMVFNVGMPLTTFWIAAALVLYVLVSVIGIFVYGPALRRQRAEAEDPSSDAYRSAAARAKALGLAVVLIVVVIVGLMVFKPTL